MKNSTVDNMNVFFESVKKIAIPKKELRLALSCCVGFFFGEAVIFGMINPFILPFLALFLGGSPFAFLSVVLFVFLGLFQSLEGVFLIKYLVALLFVLSLSLHMKINNVKLNLKRIATIMAVISFICGLIPSFYYGFSFFIFLNNIFEAFSVYCLVFVFSTGMEALRRDKKLIPVGNNEIISVALMVSIIFIGCSKIQTSFINISVFFSFLLIMVLAYTADSAKACMAGFVLGFIPYISNSEPVYFIVVFSLCGVLAGAFKEKYKVKTLIGIYSAVFFSYFYISKEIYETDILISLGLASVVFLFLPADWYLKLQATFGYYDNSADYAKKIQDLAEDRLKKYAKSFQYISNTFNNISKEVKDYETDELPNLVEEVSKSNCVDCAKQEYCWNSRQIYTYQNVLGMMEDIFAGKDESVYFENFKAYCSNYRNFLYDCEVAVKIHRLNINWLNKISDSRVLVGQQIFYISNLLESFSEDVGSKVVFHNALEGQIYENLEANNYPVEKVVIIENSEGRFEVSIQFSNCIGKKNCMALISKNVSNIVKRQMRSSNNRSCTDTKKKCFLYLVEDPNFRVTYGVAQASKDGEMVSGDNFSAMLLDNNEYFLALADGMGSGRTANKDSKATLELLEDFMESKFEKEIAIKLTNSLLLQNNRKERFSTLDICSVNLYTGMGELYKVGAVQTLIYRNKEVYRIDSKTLPIGILENVDVERVKKQFLDNDIVIMMTDGVSEVINTLENKDTWLIETIKKYNSYNPQSLAHEIIEQGKKLSGGIARDDMSVLVFRINKKTRIN